MALPTGTTWEITREPNLPGAGVSAVSELFVRKFESWEQIQHLHPLWNQLLAESASSTIFLTWEWLRSWWSAYGSSQELMLLAWFDRDRELVGLAPFYRTTRRILSRFSLRVLRFVGDGSGDSDNLDLIVRRGYETSIVRSLLDWLDANRSYWDILEFNTEPTESPVANALINELVERHWGCWREEGPHLVIMLPDKWETYWGSLSNKMRYEIMHDTRRLESKYNVRLRRCEKEEELPKFLNALFQLHRKRWALRGEAGSFSLPQRCSLYCDVAKQFLAKGWLDFWLLDLNNRTVAGLFGLRYGNTHYQLQEGFDPEYYAYSVGLVLKAMVLRELIDEGVRWYDFLGGGEPHKRRWGADRRSYYSVRCAPPRSRGFLYLEVAQGVESSKARLRACLPAPAWKLLRWTYRHLCPHKNEQERNALN